MVTVRKGKERGHANHGWLDSYHSFSFADYYDPKHMAYGALRVINEDRVQPGKGFGTHPHRDMEIVTYILDGELEHRDSMGNGSVIRRGDVQRMSAGSGVLHSEFNPSAAAPVHFLQIWVQPSTTGGEPGYEQLHYADEEKRGRLRLIASPAGEEGSVSIRQDARIYAVLLDAEDTVEHRLNAGRRAYVHVATGEAGVNGEHLRAGDAAMVSGEQRVIVSGATQSEVLLFDLA